MPWLISRVLGLPHGIIHGKSTWNHGGEAHLAANTAVPELRSVKKQVCLSPPQIEDLIALHLSHFLWPTFPFWTVMGVSFNENRLPAVRKEDSTRSLWKCLKRIGWIMTMELRTSGLLSFLYPYRKSSRTPRHVWSQKKEMGTSSGTSFQKNVTDAPVLHTLNFHEKQFLLIFKNSSWLVRYQKAQAIM